MIGALSVDEAGAVEVDVGTVVVEVRLVDRGEAESGEVMSLLNRFL